MIIHCSSRPFAVAELHSGLLLYKNVAINISLDLIWKVLLNTNQKQVSQLKTNSFFFAYFVMEYQEALQMLQKQDLQETDLKPFELKLCVFTLMKS